MRRLPLRLAGTVGAAFCRWPRACRTHSWGRMHIRARCRWWEGRTSTPAPGPGQCPTDLKNQAEYAMHGVSRASIGPAVPGQRELMMQLLPTSACMPSLWPGSHLQMRHQQGEHTHPSRVVTWDPIETGHSTRAQRQCSGHSHRRRRRRSSRRPARAQQTTSRPPAVATARTEGLRWLELGCPERAAGRRLGVELLLLLGGLGGA